MSDQEDEKQLNEAMGELNLDSPEVLFALINDLEVVQLRALLFAACRNHPDVANSVKEGILENLALEESDEEEVVNEEETTKATE